jgi:hypothetical protein
MSATVISPPETHRATRSVSADLRFSQAQPRSVAADLGAALLVCGQERMDDPSSEHYAIGLRLDRVTCRVTGPEAFRCIGTYSNGMTEQVDVAAAGDGHTWVTT